MKTIGYIYICLLEICDFADRIAVPNIGVTINAPYSTRGYIRWENPSLHKVVVKAINFNISWNEFVRYTSCDCLAIDVDKSLYGIFWYILRLMQKNRKFVFVFNSIHCEYFQLFWLVHNELVYYLRFPITSGDHN